MPCNPEPVDVRPRVAWDGSSDAEIALVQREERPSQPLRAHPLDLERDRVVVRDETQELDSRDAQATRALVGGDGGIGRAVLHQADLAEELAGADDGQLARLLGHPRVTLENDEEVLDRLALAQDDASRGIADDRGQARKAVDR